MFDTIILLTGPGEQAALSALLLGHNPGLSIRAVAAREELDTIAPELLAHARLIGFVTPVLVPARRNTPTSGTICCSRLMPMPPREA